MAGRAARPQAGFESAGYPATIGKETGNLAEPMTKEELIARAKASFKDYENGELIDLEELEKFTIAPTETS